MTNEPIDKQTIYIAIALTEDQQGVTPLCWHTDLNRAKDVGVALAPEVGLVFVGMMETNHAEYEAARIFPDDDCLNKAKG